MMPVFAPYFASVAAQVNGLAPAVHEPAPAPLDVSDAVREFVLDDYQEVVWSDGDQPCDQPEVLAKYWDEFLRDCATWGRPVPDDLSPEVYYRLWMDEYNDRVKGEE